MLAYAPLFPHPKEEKWNFIVADAAKNTVYSRQEVSLIEAEAVGIAHTVRCIPSQSFVVNWQQVLKLEHANMLQVLVSGPGAPRMTI